MKILSFILFLLAVSFGVHANEKTVRTVFQDENGKDSLIRKKAVNKDALFYDTSHVFQTYWNEKVTFSYDVRPVKANEKIAFTDSTHSYCFPVEKETTSRYGKRHGSFHKGIDIPLHTGDPVVAAFDGKVRYARYNSGGFGNLVIIRHRNGMETYYAHLSKLKVKPNQIVKAGQLIGLGGSTGRSYSPHLHFETRYNDKAFNPEKIFDTESYCLKVEEIHVSELMQKRDYTPSYHPNEQFLANGKVYSIQPGDTLSKIAARNGTSVSQLCVLNGLDQSSILQIGQRIRVN